MVQKVLSNFARKKSRKDRKAHQKTPPKSPKKSNLSPSEAAKSKTSAITSFKSLSQENRFDFTKHMADCGYSKFDFKKMDLYRFLDAYEKGSSKLKLNDEDKISHFFLYLDQDAKRVYLELQVYSPVSNWEDFKQLWIDNFHEKTYDRLWKYLTSQETGDDLSEFAQKKFEVFWSFFKTIGNIEIIQLINVSMPKDIQPILMSKMFSSFSAYIKFLKEKEMSRGEGTENEDEDNEKVDEDDDENGADNDEDSNQKAS